MIRNIVSINSICQYFADNELTTDLKEIFIENLCFECCTIPFENNQPNMEHMEHSRNTWTEADEKFCCFVCFVGVYNEVRNIHYL